jgi:hypothetical protein
MEVAINQAFIAAGGQLEEGKIYTITGDLIMTTPFRFNELSAGSILGGTPITVNGNNHTITVPDSVSSWPGLFGKPVQVNNLGILSTISADPHAGWFFQAAISGLATKCYSTGNINLNGGGIFGSQSRGVAIDCYSTGQIYINGGGIFGAASDSGRAENCYSTGDSNNYGGGIFAGERSDVLGNSNVVGTAINCYSRGSIGYRGGGIFGGSEDLGSLSSTCNFTATNCYSTGPIMGPGGGEIVGPFTGFGSSVNVTHWYATSGGAWDDAAASAEDKLTGISPSTIWTSDSPNTPYFLVTNRPPRQNDTTLSQVYANGVLLLAATSNQYTYVFDSSASPISFRLVTTDPLATVSINGQSGTSDISGTLPLVPNSNSFTILVTAQNGDSRSYSLQINTPESNDVTLSTVKANGDDLSLDPITQKYTYQFNSRVSSISFRLITGYSLATVSINGQSGTNDISGTLPLVPNSNSFTILVTAQNGDSRSYSLQINTPQSNDTSLSSLVVAGTNIDLTATEPIVQVPVGTTSVSVVVTPTFEFATYTVAGNTNLITGLNTVTIQVTAQNGDFKNYRIKINTLSNDTSLSSLVVNGIPIVLTKDTYEYTVQLPVGATNALVNAIPTDLLASIANTGTNNLTPGVNTLTVRVTAPNGNFKNYIVQMNVTPKSNDTSLSKLVVAGTNIDLTATEPTVNVPAGTTSVPVIATPTNRFAVFTVIGNTTLRPVVNTIRIMVTAQNGATKNYLVKINILSYDTSLSSLVVNGTNIDLTIKEPTVVVPTGTTRVGVSAIASDAAASVLIFGSTNLFPGVNTLTVQVTVPGGKFRIYTVKIYVTPALLASPTITITSLTNNSANLSWTSILNAKNYNVYQSTDDKIYTLLKNTTGLSLIINTRVIGLLYLKVAAVDSSNIEGIRSAALSVLLKWPPLAPTNLRAIANSNRFIRFTWDAPADTGNVDIGDPQIPYKVYYTFLGDIFYENIVGTIKIVTNPFEPFPNNTFFTFRVVASNSEGEGPESSELQFVYSDLRSYINNVGQFSSAVASLKNNNFDAILSARAAINNAAKEGTLMDRDRQKLTVAALNAINTTGETLAISRSNTKEILATMKTNNTSAAIDVSKPVVVVIPNYVRSGTSSLYTATIYLDTETAQVQEPTKVNVSTFSYADIIGLSKAYIVFELPNSTPDATYTLTLWHGSESRTIQYDGTVLIDQNLTKYTANDLLRIGALTIPLIGLGSLGGAPLLNKVTIDSFTIPNFPYTYVVTSNAASVLIDVMTTSNIAKIVVQDSTYTQVLSGIGRVTGSLDIGVGDNIFYIIIGGSTYTFTVTTNAAPCFPTGTRILTVDGYKKVEDLIAGELVMTSDGLRVPIKIYEADLSITTTETAPFRIPKGTFGPAAPANDLILSPMHFFQIKKGLWMLPKLAAILSDKVEQIMVGSPITYYHIECPQYLRDNLIVDGTIVESFGAEQLTTKPYTYNTRLKGFTRVGYVKTKAITKA